jgi:thiamine-monophosphate kinase
VETDFVRRLLPTLPRDRRLEVPAGDDAAVLRPPGNRRTVVTVDMLTEGVDFLFDGVLAQGEPTRGFPPPATAEQVGRKAVAVSLSDLAAMAARPEAIVVAVALPRKGGRTIADEIAQGVAAMAAAYDVAIAGGDTNAWDGPLVVSVTAIGSVSSGHAWRRDTAQPGDLLVVTGPLGGSLLGRHLAVTPRCLEAEKIAAQFAVHAAIDVSDGLALDCTRLLTASGVGGVLDLPAIPIHPDAIGLHDLRPADAHSPLEHALGDGEDFELLLAMPAEAAAAFVATNHEQLLAGTSMQPAVIGTVVAEPGLQARHADGTLRPLAALGFDHAFE